MKKKLDVVKLRQGLSDTFSSVLALLLAFVVSGLIVMITGANPFAVFGSLFKGGLGSPMALAGTLNRMAPILLAGLAITAGNSCGVFNMGFTSQFLMGFLCAGFVGYMVPLPPALLIPLTMLAAVFGAMLWAFFPIMLNIKRNVNIIFSCIMLNYIAKYLLNYLVQKFPGYVPSTGGSPSIQEAAELPYLITKPYKISLGVLFSLLCLVALYVILFKMRTGYEMRAAGLSRTAAWSSGIAVQKKAVAGMLLSGVFTGICAALEVMGTTGRVLEDYDPGYMGLGIAIAMLGKQNPVMILIAGFLFAAMKNGTTLMQMNTGISAQFVLVIEGLLIIFIGIGPLFRYVMNKLNERRVKSHA
ncbi:ABC transporter permease [Anaerofilum sp. BX8]|uniref:ABC transporter permease n=1 Tax=Anaerofilum hominis TaxID=2763016 RepID=A0A923L220_9FIRM|nr:ABC transporter permease [Anaerofilum hominis]MBC5582403.1 ABC transporter permease [Anaerofilum hominis]